MQGYATRRQAIAGVLAQRGVCAGTDAGRTWAAEGHGRRLIVCTRNRTDPISGFAKNGDAPEPTDGGLAGHPLCKAVAVSQVAQLLAVSDGYIWRTLDLTSIRRTLKRTSRPSLRLVSTRPPRGADTNLSVCFTTSTPSVYSMPARGEKPRSWPSLPMRSRLMAPVPRTSVRSVWIGRRATRLACVSICLGRRSPSMSFTSFSSSTGRSMRSGAKKSRGPRSGGAHATFGSRTSTLGVTGKKPSSRSSRAEISRHTAPFGSRRRYARSSTALRVRHRPSRSSTGDTAGCDVVA